MKQTKPFCVVFDEELKQALAALAREKQVPYGVYFSTSGRALIEPVRETVLYGYVWRTDRDII